MRTCPVLCFYINFSLLWTSLLLDLFAFALYIFVCIRLKIASLPIPCLCVAKIKAKWAKKQFVTQQVEPNLTAEGFLMFKHLRQSKLWGIEKTQIQPKLFFCKVALYQSLLSRQNEDTTICQMSVTGLDFQSYLSLPLCTSQDSLYINLALYITIAQAVGIIVTCKMCPNCLHIQGVFFDLYLPKKLRYGKPMLGESTLT